MQTKFLVGDLTPPDNALVVCAGTVTCTDVRQMGLGFGFFKTLFGKTGAWSEDYQPILTNFHDNNEEMPAFFLTQKMIDAKTPKGNFIGGIATVADRSALPIVNPRHLSNIQQIELVAQYKSAVQGAIDAAVRLGVPLYIQPLGIGGYRWPATEAADIFADLIFAASAEGVNLEIHIPLYGSEINSGCSNCDTSQVNDNFAHQLYHRLKDNKQNPLPCDIVNRSIPRPQNETYSNFSSTDNRQNALRRGTLNRSTPQPQNATYFNVSSTDDRQNALRCDTLNRSTPQSQNETYSNFSFVLDCLAYIPLAIIAFICGMAKTVQSSVINSGLFKSRDGSKQDSVPTSPPNPVACSKI